MVKHLIATNRKDFNISASNESQLGVEGEFTFGVLSFEPEGDSAHDQFSALPDGASDYSTCLSVPKNSLKGS